MIHTQRFQSLEGKASLGDEPSEKLKDLVLRFLISQTHALPVLTVKQELEKHWSISKANYDFKWKKFLQTIEYVQIDTRLQPNGKPIDFTYFDESQANADVVKYIQEEIFFERNITRHKPMTLNELVALTPGRKHFATLNPPQPCCSKREEVILMTTQKERKSKNCWYRLLSKMRLA